MSEQVGETVQLLWRQPGEDEPLTTLEIYGVRLFMDAAGTVVVADVPAGYEVYSGRGQS